MEQSNENWYDIPDYVGYYQFSDCGRIKSVERIVPSKRWGAMTIKERIFKPGIDRKGYLYVILSKNGKQKIIYIHRLVARQLVHNPDPEHLTEINHIDENKHNNRPSNLEFCTPKYNSNYGTRNQRISIANTNNPKISKPIRCVETNVVYPSIHEAKRMTGIRCENICKCLKGNHHTAGGYHWEYV